MVDSANGIAVIAGVGEGVGGAIARRFAKAGHHVVMFARNEEKLEAYAKEIRGQGGKATAMKVDLRSEQEVIDAVNRIEQDLGPIAVAIYNAGAQHKKPLLDITGDQFEKVWRLGCFGAFNFGREAIRHMAPRGAGTVLFTGATSALRGGATFAAFASAKFGVRAISQSMAREFGPKGIHVASVIIDGAVDMPAIHRLMPDFIKTLPPDGMLNTDAVADAFYAVHQQHRSAWTLELDVRPYSEKF